MVRDLTPHASVWLYVSLTHFDVFQAKGGTMQKPQESFYADNCRATVYADAAREPAFTVCLMRWDNQGNFVEVSRDGFQPNELADAIRVLEDARRYILRRSNVAPSTEGG